MSDFKNLQKEDVFPYGEKINLSWYYGYYSGYFTGDFVKLEDHPFMKRREEDTNIHITYQVPTATTLEGGRAEIETMLASGTLTDLVTQTYFGLALEGPTLDSVIDEEIYLNLTELSEQNMPNFNRMRERFPLIDKIIETPRDNIVYIPMLSGLEKDVDHPKQTGGLVIRKDFLDECQLDVPETVDDWNNVLTKFKQMGVETPLALGSMKYSPSMGYDMFITAYGQRFEWYLGEDGTVKYGVTEEGVHEYVKLMNRWVSDGLAAAVDVTADLRTSDKLGAWVGTANDIMTCKQNAINPNYELVACPDPVLKIGDTINGRQKTDPVGSADRNQVYLSADCSDPQAACRWLDLFFTGESYMESSYGLEGEDYTIDADGNVTFTEKITQNADGLRYGIEQNAFLNSFWRDPDVVTDHTYTEEANAACKVWSKAGTNQYLNTNYLSFTEQESNTLQSSSLFWVLQQYYLKGMILGDCELSKWDEYITEMNEAGLEKYIAIYQAAYDRFNK